MLLPFLNVFEKTTVFYANFWTYVALKGINIFFIR